MSSVPKDASSSPEPDPVAPHQMEQLWWHNDHHEGAALHCDDSACRDVGQAIAAAVKEPVTYVQFPRPLPAVPTTYRGHLFRSRLEADWACTLDHCGIPWEYENRGFELSDGQWYLPDFYLPSAKAWLEVKGPHGQGVGKVEQFAIDLWSRLDPAACTTDPDAPLVLLAGPSTHVPGDPGGPWSLVAVRDHRKRYSVLEVRCPGCDHGTILAKGALACRGCGHRMGDDWLDWLNHRFFPEMTPAPLPLRKRGK